MYFTLKSLVAALAPWDKKERISILAMAQDLLGKLTPDEHLRLMENLTLARHTTGADALSALENESKAILDKVW